MYHRNILMMVVFVSLINIGISKEKSQAAKVFKKAKQICIQQIYKHYDELDSVMVADNVVQSSIRHSKEYLVFSEQAKQNKGECIKYILNSNKNDLPEYTLLFISFWDSLSEEEYLDYIDKLTEIAEKGKISVKTYYIVLSPLGGKLHGVLYRNIEDRRVKSVFKRAKIILKDNPSYLETFKRLEENPESYSQYPIAELSDYTPFRLFLFYSLIFIPVGLLIFIGIFIKKRKKNYQ